MKRAFFKDHIYSKFSKKIYATHKLMSIILMFDDN